MNVALKKGQQKTQTGENNKKNILSALKITHLLHFEPCIYAICIYAICIYAICIYRFLDNVEILDFGLQYHIDIDENRALT